MAKFHVTIKWDIQREEMIEIDVFRDEVIYEMDLTGEDRRDWRDHVEDYLNNNQDSIYSGKVLTTDDSADSDFEIMSVE
jgi:hypothetical protein|tara:strand:+ start:87 stop:323 length:237 start_codon:yes stop_codon:yes gene_type:complete